MMLAGFLFLLLLTGGVHPEGNCSYQSLFKYLNLTKNNELYTMVRPVKHYKDTTWVQLKMVIYGILDVREIDQTLVLYVWIYMSWRNHHIEWNPDMFCGLNHVVFPTEVLWKPDLIIEEMTEKDKSPPNPYIGITYDGLVESRTDQVLVSTCRMQVYKFPFDIQSCNLSFKSALHCADEIKFEAILNGSKITEWSKEVMPNQYEWLLISMTVHNKTVNNFGYNQSMVVYTCAPNFTCLKESRPEDVYMPILSLSHSATNWQQQITMKRRSVLYIANFLLPVLFFFCLDLASFLISDSGGEKLGFKVTVMLAVTVMQLILNEILPSSSDRIPLIAIYCIGIFGLMMLSLLETILVMYLLEKDNEADKDQSLSEDCGDKRGKANLHSCFREVKKWTHCACVCDVSADETPSELLSVAKEGSSNQLTEESCTLEKVSNELTEMEKTLTLLLNSRKEERKPGYWARVTKTINRVFFISYVTVASLFLIVIFSIWNTAADE